MADVTVFPEVWKEYSDRQVASMAGQKLLPGEYSPCRRYVLINTETAESHFLLDAPVADPSSRVAWSVDNQSVVITQTYLPFDDTEGGERKERGFKYFAAEVRISTGGYAKVSNEDLRRLRLLSWDKKRNRLIFEANTTSENPRPGSKVIFWKNGEKWEKATITAPENSAPKIVLEEDLNTPPRMFAVNPATDNKSLLLDLNPDFSQLTFGRVENIRFKSSDRRERNGGLYYPVNYIAGKRYPLVIQTHGWAPGVHRFLMNGFSTTSNAAQPLAGRGIMVLQVDDMDRNADGTPEEAPEAAGVYEGAIDYLDERALIDRNRVGIIGFSRTCYYVKYALTHSKYHFVAASVADGIDGGYVDYQLLATSPVRAKDQEGVNGGYPFGAGLKLWIEHSPGFNVDKVHTPLLITALRPNSAKRWRWFICRTVRMNWRNHGTG